MQKQYAKNKKAYHDYEIIESIEVGIKLTGPEVKSVRNSQINLLGSYASIEGTIVLLKQCHISRPDHIGGKAFDELRQRPLLLHKSEILKLHNKVKEKGLSLAVTEVYQRDGCGTIKCKLNLVKGKRDYDKRQDLKAKAQAMDTKRALKDY